MRPNSPRIPRLILLLTLCASSLFAAGCDHKKDKDDPAPVPQFESKKAIVRFKRNDRIKTDFANALGIPEANLCMELGLYSCTDLVHSVALGAVEPYVIGLYEPLPRTGVTTPIVLDRVALSGCAQRIDLDLANPAGALIFRGLPIGADGKLLDLQAPGVASSLETMYRRGLQRHATEAEINHLKSLYADVDASSPEAARDWALLSCFATLTTLESVFY